MDEPEKVRIANIIKKARKDHGLSQTQFANTISQHLPKDVKKQDVSKWENERTTPDYWLVFALCFVPNDSSWVISMANKIWEILNEKYEAPF